MKFTISATLLALLAAMPTVQAHIEMISPAPIRHKSNPNSKQIDYSYTSPMSSPAQFPCKGLLNGATDAELTPTATWPAGSKQSFKLSSGATHGGGSCQASISEDMGKTWKAIETYNGGCPLAGSYDFTVPKETKNGKVLFAWSWFNKVGVREMYMNCASITITGGGSGLSGKKDMVVANSANPACTFPEGMEPDLTKGCPASGAPSAAAPSTGTPSTPATPATPATSSAAPKPADGGVPATNNGGANTGMPGKTQWYDPSTNPGIPKAGQRKRRAVAFRA